MQYNIVLIYKHILYTIHYIYTKIRSYILKRLTVYRYAMLTKTILNHQYANTYKTSCISIG